MLAALPLAWRLGIAAATILALLGSVGGIYLKIRADAYREGYSTASAECEADKREMEEANEKAIAEAKKKLLEAEKELVSQETRIDELLTEIDHAADADPDAGTCGLGIDGVRRLQNIK
jgi:uncharacterized protein HemX